jgi:hypothetical protein
MPFSLPLNASPFVVGQVRGQGVHAAGIDLDRTAIQAATSKSQRPSSALTLLSQHITRKVDARCGDYTASQTSKNFGNYPFPIPYSKRDHDWL